MASEFDLIIRDGRVFDAEKRSFVRRDIAIAAGRIVRIGRGIADGEGAASIDGSGKLVLPGLVDAHVHIYWGATPLGINPENHAWRTGTTAWLDYGSAGPANIEGLCYHVIRPSPLLIRALLNLSYVGLTPVGNTTTRYGELFDARLIDPEAVARAYEEFAQELIGIKIRLGVGTSAENGDHALRTALRVADYLSVPLFVHATAPPPYIEEVLGRLRAGDVLTHCYNGNRFSRLLDRSGEVKRAAEEARDRGVLFDLGHGAGCFSWGIAESAARREFWPDFISSDVHAYNVAGPAVDLPTTISKMVALGLREEEAFYRATLGPAKLMGIDSKSGSIEEGKRADIVLAEWSDEPGELLDSSGESREGRLLEIHKTILGGSVLEETSDGRVDAKWKPGLLTRFKSGARTSL